MYSSKKIVSSTFTLFPVQKAVPEPEDDPEPPRKQRSPSDTFNFSTVQGADEECREGNEEETLAVAFVDFSMCTFTFILFGSGNSYVI